MPDSRQPEAPAVLVVTGSPAREADRGDDLGAAVVAAAGPGSAWLHVGPGPAPVADAGVGVGVEGLDLHEWARRHGAGGARPWPARAKDVRLGLWALRRRRLPAVLVGWSALGALGALHRHVAPVVWLAGPPPGTAPAVLPAPADLARITAAVVADPTAASALVALAAGVGGAPPRRVDLPGWMPVAPPPPDAASPVVRVHGPADPEGGLDLLGRAVAAVADDLRALGARIEWERPVGAPGPSADEVADLRAMGAAERIDHVEGAGRDPGPWVGAAAAVAPARTAAWDPRVAAGVAAAGTPVIAWADAGAPDPIPAPRCRTVPFPDVAALGRELVDAARAQRDGDPTRRGPAPPTGLAALVAAV